jgi:N-succinyldiaminopimelate aminotransferase
VSDLEFARTLHAQYNVTVLPGSYLAREARGINPGRNFVRVALVPPLADCLEAVRRLRAHLGDLQNTSQAAIKANL